MCPIRKKKWWNLIVDTMLKKQALKWSEIDFNVTKFDTLFY